MAGALTAAIAAAFAGGVTADPYFEYTTLLLPGNGTNGAQNNTFLDNSTNNFTITRNGNTTQGTFSPFSQTGWGNYFDTSGHALGVSNGLIQTTDTTFTMECWVYMLSNPTGGNPNTFPVLIGQMDQTAGTIRLALGPDGNGKLNFYWYDGSNKNVISTTTIQLNTWTHIAVSVNSNAITLYINGTSSGTGTLTNRNSLQNTFYIGNHYTTVYNYVGYVSQVRVVSGVAVYTGNFTPPTSLLTATQSSGTNISAITTGQTKLLTCQSNRFVDNGQGNTSNTPFAITVAGSPTVVAFSPFNPSASWSAATYGGSGYFDGSGDYLSVASNTAFDFGTGDFTIELWINLSAAANYGGVLTKGNVGAISSATWAIDFNNTGTALNFYVGAIGSGAYIITTTTNVRTLNAWTHVAVSRISGSTKMFINGVQEGSTYSTSYNVTSGGDLYVGTGFYTPSTNFVTGYISNVRILKGTGLYSSAFTPPTAPLTAITNTSLLLNFTNAGIFDATSKNDLETVGNAQISTTQSKWGGSSMYFDGTGDWLLSTPSVINDFGTGNFTIEAWIYMTSTSNYFYIYNSSNANFNSPNFTFLYDTSLGLRMYAHGGTYTVNQGSTSGWAANTWYYVALVRNGGTITIYRNGTSLASGSTFSGVSFGSATAPLQIGGSSPDSRSNNGYIQDLRVSRYARDVTTTPTAAFPTL